MSDQSLIPTSDRYDQPAMIETIRQTVCKGATDAQFRMFIEVCRGSGLNPFLREIWFVPSVGIMAGRDGYLAVANKHPQFDGMETRVERDEKNVPIKATCTVWRKDRVHPIICEAYYNEYKKGGGVWAQYPSAMISKVAEVLALKRSFAINGVVTEEEIGNPEPRGSAAAAQGVAQAKIAGSMPLVAEEDKQPATEPPVEQDVLTQTLATFTSRAAITAAFAELQKAFLRFATAEEWTQALAEFGIQDDKYPTIGAAKKAFTAMWRTTEKMTVGSDGGYPHEQ